MTTNPMATPYDRACDRLGRDLELPYNSQDWGLCNQDPSRLEEFVDYIIAHRDDLTDMEQTIMGELIMASADRGLADDPAFDLSPFERFVDLTKDDPAQSLNYEIFGEDLGMPGDPTPLAAVIERLLEGR